MATDVVDCETVSEQEGNSATNQPWPFLYTMATDVVDREIVSEQEGNGATVAFPVAHVLCDCVNLSQAHNI